MTALISETTALRRAPAPAKPSEPAEDVDLQAVKTLMLQLAAGDRFERLGAIAQEHLFTAGKKLRARIAMTAIDALGGPSEARIGWAASCELLHNATLIHDDLQDGDIWRRGKYAVWVRHGQAQAINAGDLLLMLPYISLEHVETDDATRWQLSRAIARRAEQTVRGQSLEMTLLDSGRWTVDDYSAAAVGKTSALFALPVEGAALICGRTREEAVRLGDAFGRIGLLFQMQDDVLDLYGDKQREKVGNDIREGSVTVLVAEHLERHPEDEKWIVSVLAADRASTSDGDVARITERFRRTGTLDAVLDRIDRLAAEALEDPMIAAVPALRRTAEAMIHKCLQPISSLLDERRSQR